MSVDKLAESPQNGVNCSEETCSICQDVNTYATRKSVAQGLIDLALLSANAAQLRAVLTVGDKYKYFTLMLWLLAISVTLQLIQAALLMFLGLACNINKAKRHRRATIANNFVVAITTVTTFVNVGISFFEIQDSSRFSGL